MKQEEKKPDVSDYLLKLFEMYESGKVTGIKIQVDASLNNEEVTALQKENDQLKAKLETAKEALRFYADKKKWSHDYDQYDRGFSRWCILYGDIEEINDSVGYAGQRARAALKEIEGES